MGLRNFIRYRIEAGKRGFLSRPADDWHIAIEGDGITVTHMDFRPFLAKGVARHQFAWADIERIFAGQSDNLTWDAVWLTFVLGSGATCAVPETASGWNELLQQMPANLPDSLPVEDWLPQVTRSAFEPNVMQLYPGGVRLPIRSQEC